MKFWFKFSIQIFEIDKKKKKKGSMKIVLVNEALIKSEGILRIELMYMSP